jgi:hypothetical protein
MTTRPYATTNARLDEVCEMVEELIGWAIADAEHAAENDAPETAKDDLKRAYMLQIAQVALKGCRR